MIPEVDIPEISRPSVVEAATKDDCGSEAVPDVMRPVSSQTKNQIYQGISKEGNHFS